MKVSELIEKLQTLNPEAKVLLYSWEDFSELSNVKTKSQNQGENQSYCKGYSFTEFEKEYQGDYVILGDLG